jgi:hypothetical protein
MESQVVEISGYVGQYRTIVEAKDGSRNELEHGVVVVATGGKEIEPAVVRLRRAAGRPHPARAGRKAG